MLRTPFTPRPIHAVVCERSNLDPSSTVLRIAQHGVIFRMKFNDGVDDGTLPRLEKGCDLAHDRQLGYDKCDHVELLSSDEHAGTFPVVLHRFNETTGGWEKFASWGGKDKKLTPWVRLNRPERYELRSPGYEKTVLAVNTAEPEFGVAVTAQLVSKRNEETQTAIWPMWDYREIGRAHV